MDKNVKVKYNKLKNMEFNNQGYINLNETIINNKYDLANMCNIFRDPRYETFRIFYMKDNKIVGQEYITSKIPNAVDPMKEKKMTPVIYYEKMRNRMKRLNADGYYLAHNHPTESATPSKSDMIVTRNFEKNVKGFMAHIVLGSKDRYAIIDRSYNGILLYRENYIDNQEMNNIKESLEGKTFFDVKITSTSELVAMLKQIQIDDDYSIAILTDCKLNIRMVVDIPDKMLNQEYENLNGFFKNMARNCGAVHVLIGTNNLRTYYKIIQHHKFGTFQDMVYLKDPYSKVCEKNKTYSLFYKEELKKKKKTRER